MSTKRRSGEYEVAVSREAEALRTSLDEWHLLLVARLAKRHNLPFTIQTRQLERLGRRSRLAADQFKAWALGEP